MLPNEKYLLEIGQKCTELGAAKEQPQACFASCGPGEFIIPGKLPYHCIAKEMVDNEKAE